MSAEKTTDGGKSRERENTPNADAIVERDGITDAFDRLSAIEPGLEDILSSISLDQKTLAGRIESVKEFVREGGFKNTEKALGEDEALFETVYMILGPEFVDGQRVKVREFCKTMEDIFKMVYESFPVIVSGNDSIGQYLRDGNGEVSDERFLEVRKLAVLELAQVRAENQGVNLGDDNDKKVWDMLGVAEERVKRKVEEMRRRAIKPLKGRAEDAIG